mmetsp:Transcript_13627/g.23202  ORF Transcript_13627/g.23202 Transcript_13627/m.23202 type:complete len:271 (+) Transcript_13627:32-844(+)
MAAAEEPAADEISIVRCGTSTGPIVLEFHREWSPHGYDRAVELFSKGFFDHTHFFRVVPGFLVQFGITYSTSQALKQLGHTQIPDDPPLEPKMAFAEGTISYAGSGPDSRTSQLFISYGAHSALGTQPWETPVGKVIEGMENVRAFYSYGDMPPWGKGPVQGKIHAGPSYIEDNFPLTDKFQTCNVERGGSEAATDRELLQDTGDEWKVKAMPRVPGQDKLKKFLKSSPLKQASIGGTDELGMLVIIVVIILASFLLAKLRFKQKSSKSV